MNNNLFICGCSFSAEFDYTHPTYIEYKEYLGGELPKTWSQILSEKLNLTYRNYACRSVGNEQIFHQFCSIVDELKENDVLILQWSYRFRYRWASYDGNTWMHMGPGKIDESVIDKRTHENNVVNRENKQYKKMVLEDYMKIINTICEYKKVKVFYWAAGDLFDENLFTDKKYMLSDVLSTYFEGDLRHYIKNIVCGILEIKEETNGKIIDGHNGKIGHEVQAQLFYEYLIKNI